MPLKKPCLLHQATPMAPLNEKMPNLKTFPTPAQANEGTMSSSDTESESDNGAGEHSRDLFKPFSIKKRQCEADPPNPETERKQLEDAIRKNEEILTHINGKLAMANMELETNSY